VTGAPAALLLMGPTAAGKSGIAVEVAAEVGAEIVSVDSCAIYRGLDIGTAKPDAAQRAAVPHHLVDVRDPDESYSVGEFLRGCRAAMDEIAARGRLPMLVGGTMMYFHALLRGISDLPPVPARVRAEVRAELAERGPAALHAWLGVRDPETAALLKPGDSQRIARAAEILRATGRSLREWHSAMPRAGALGEGAVAVALSPADTGALRERIARRTRDFVEAGWAAEVARLLELDGVTPASQSMRTVGYRQMARHVLGETSLEEAAGRAEIATRQLAKRQRTWLRHLREDALVLDPFDPGCAGEVLRIARRAGAG